MKLSSFFAVYLLASTITFAQQAPVDDPRYQEIQARRARGEKMTEADRDYFATIIERQNQENTAKKHAEYARQHPPRESTGLIPIAELGRQSWEGLQGGLYPGGVNTPPQEHLQAGLQLAARIVPLDQEGHASPGGRIVMASIGMSNTTQETRSFIQLAAGDPDLNPKFIMVDCAQGAQTAARIKDANAPFWTEAINRLRNAGATPAQLQIVWLKEANAGPQEPATEYARLLHDDLVGVLHTLLQKFPNLKIAYVSGRIYGGYAGSPLNPEPYAYASSFSVKQVIADQIEGKPEMNYDPAKGPVRSPWVAWGPDLWGDGMKPRADGLIWKREDLGPDGTHPSIPGREKVARLLMAFLKTDPTAKPWFLKQ